MTVMVYGLYGNKSSARQANHNQQQGEASDTYGKIDYLNRQDRIKATSAKRKM